MRERRAQAVDELLGRALDAGCELRFLTVTIEHHVQQRLDALWEPLQAAYSYAFGGRGAQPGRELVRHVDAFGPGEDLIEEVRSSWFWGQIRALDLTCGCNGWHPHIHSVLVFAPGTPTGMIARWMRERRDLFHRALGCWGLYSAPDRRGWHVQAVKGHDGTAVAIAGYVAKLDAGWGAGLELARTDLKSARRGGRTPFELLAAAADGDDDAHVRFLEYERATAGRKLLVTSRRLTAIFAVDPDEGTDEELAEADQTGEFVIEHTFSADEWMRAVRKGYVVDLIEYLRVEGATIAHNAGSAEPVPAGGSP